MAITSCTLHYGLAVGEGAAFPWEANSFPYKKRRSQTFHPACPPKRSGVRERSTAEPNGIHECELTNLSS